MARRIGYVTVKILRKPGEELEIRGEVTMAWPPGLQCLNCGDYFTLGQIWAVHSPRPYPNDPEQRDRFNHGVEYIAEAQIAHAGCILSKN